MVYFARALSAEVLKIKRTLALAVAVALPLVIVVMNLFILIRMRVFDEGFDGWQYLLLNSIVLWGLLMLPLYITLETALLAGLEHGDKNWKQLFALPIPRPAIYAAKQAVSLGMVALSMVVLVLGALAAGML